ncbi:ATP-dependent DNA ligase, partial [Escherichia coli]
LPEGTVLDGEILAWDGDRPAPFAQLQRRLGCKTVGKKLLQEIPCTLVCFDLLEWQGQDLRNQPIATRRRLIEAIPGIRVSPTVEAESWEELARRR